MGILDQVPNELADRATMRLAQPVLSGIDGGRSISFHQLGRAGVTVLGGLAGADRKRLTLASDRDDNVAYADMAAAAFRREIDQYIEASGLVAPEPDPDPADEPHPLPAARHTLDLAGAGVGTVLWCTGHEPHTPWLTVAASHPGVHVIGRPWLTHRSSGILLPRGARAELGSATAGVVTVGSTSRSDREPSSPS